MKPKPSTIMTLSNIRLPDDLTRRGDVCSICFSKISEIITSKSNNEMF